MTSKALYLHVPFCAHICAYCDFCHWKYSSSLVTKWFEALEKELQASDIPLDLRTIYLGGGTPVSLSEEELDKLLSFLDPYTKEVKEYTIEINPEVMTEEKVIICQNHGINRASIGLQSSDNQLLKLLGRHHRFSQVRECMNLLRKHGIENLSLDLMYSIPSQTLEVWKNSVKDALSLNPTHLSLYSLTIEENTEFGKKQYQSLDSEMEADMYEWMVDYLEHQGFVHYEIANFAKPGYESQHNQVYWNYQDFIGISVGASGKEGHRRYDKTRSFKAYLEQPLERNWIELSEKEEEFEWLMMGLRLKKGVSLLEFQERFQQDFKILFQASIQKHLELGNVLLEGDTLRCSPQGFPILQTILVDFLIELE